MRMTRLVVLMIVLALLVVQNASAATWYVGAEHPNSYGVWAYINTPTVAPFTVPPANVSGGSNWVSTPVAPNWIQAGWHYYYGFSAARPYVEICLNNCATRIVNDFGTQAWGSTVEYVVHHMPGTTDQWCAYIGGIQRDCRNILIPPTTVQVYSEIHESPLNGLETEFNPVYYMDSTGVWHLFDQNTTFTLITFPYKLLVFQNWDFLTYRSVTFERYVPLVVK